MLTPFTSNEKNKVKTVNEPSYPQAMAKFISESVFKKKLPFSKLKFNQINKLFSPRKRRAQEGGNKIQCLERLSKQKYVNKFSMSNTEITSGNAT